MSVHLVTAEMCLNKRDHPFKLIGEKTFNCLLPVIKIEVFFKKYYKQKNVSSNYLKSHSMVGYVVYL